MCISYFYLQSPNETKFQFQVLQQLRMLASQVESVSSDLHSIKTAMNSLQTDQHVMRVGVYVFVVSIKNSAGQSVCLTPA
jgi:hypothetical protein